jgi:hypothetical protein
MNHTTGAMNIKPNLNEPGPLYQDEIQPGHLQDGLRILARIIARDLLARRSAYTKKNDVKVDDTQVSTHD